MARGKARKAVVLLGADIAATDRLRKQCRNALVIAADSGIRHAGPLGLKVDLWVGDFDSSAPEYDGMYRDVPRQAFPPEKDKTDGELAIAHALEQGCESFLLIGALGGERSDHALLIAIQAIELACSGKDVVLSSGREEAMPVLPGTGIYGLEAGDRFSLVGFTTLTGVSITGAKWPLTNRTIPAGSSLTLSNIASGTVTISMKKGRALFICGSGG